MGSGDGDVLEAEDASDNERTYVEEASIHDGAAIPLNPLIAHNFAVRLVDLVQASKKPAPAGRSRDVEEG